MHDRSLRYRVIDGDRVYESLPGIVALYNDVLRLAQRYDSNLVPFANQTARVNVNVTPPHGEYRWHYDRNAVTAVLFLNEVEGGEIEMYPRFRWRPGNLKDGRLQHMCDALFLWVRPFFRPIVVQPAAGRMILMQGDRCLHSVRPVEGSRDRISVIMAYDTAGSAFSCGQYLNSYLYSPNSLQRNDPNYRA